jgi:hypothetical protein
MKYGFTLLRAAGLALRRPGLAWVLLRLAWRLRTRDWYRRPPFLPLPSAEYLAWRTHTAFGEGEHEAESKELERYIEWVRWMRPPKPRA